MKLRNKFILIFVAISALPVIIFAISLAGLLISKNRTDILEDLKFDVDRRSKLLTDFIVEMKNDVQFLSNLHSIKQVIQQYERGNTDKNILSNAEAEFTDFMKHKKQYMQLRYLDENGMEIIRVDNQKNQTKLVTDLQNKASRDYFTKAMVLNIGKIYISDLDLNMEHGTVEIPYNPVIRLSRVVGDSSGNKKGIIVLNVFMKSFLDTYSRGTLDQSYLVNQDGYFIDYPNLGDTSKAMKWGWMLGNPENTLQNVISKEMWHRISSSQGGLYETSKSLFYYKKMSIYPATDPRYFISISGYRKLKLNSQNYEILVLTISFAGISILVALFISFIFSRAISKPISAGFSFAEKIAGKDLTSSIDSKVMDRKDEIGILIKSLVNMKNNLAEILFGMKNTGGVLTTQIIQLSTAIEETASTIEEFMASTHAISDNTQLQSELAQNVSAAVTEITANIHSVTNNIGTQAELVMNSAGMVDNMAKIIQSNTEKSADAKNISDDLKKTADKGGQAIHDAIVSIMGIEEVSRKITEIVSVITGIASKTNLLSINAAIEAAHAGEAGKGFAVVAQEVRKLAETASSSSTEIMSHLSEIISRIKNTVILSKDAELGLNHIIQDIEHVGSANTDIFTSMNKQTQVVNSVLDGMGKVVSITQEINAAITEVNTGSQQIISSVTDLEMISNKISSATKEQAIGSKEILHAIEDENRSISNIKEINTSFESMIQQFKLPDNRTDD